MNAKVLVGPSGLTGRLGFNLNPAKGFFQSTRRRMNLSSLGGGLGKNAWKMNSVITPLYPNPTNSMTRRYMMSGIDDQIAQQLKKAPVVVYMKGTPQSPACGFSRAVVEVLKLEHVTDYNYYNVLEDDVLRQGIKNYSNWPTIPQVYIGGEFVGGCDIVLEMHQDGKLSEALEKVGAIAKHK